MSAVETTVQDAYDSVTGYDEIGIEQHFGIDVHLDQANKPGKWLRALIFVDLVHQGVDRKSAHQQAMDMPTGQTSDYFADDADLVDVAPDLAAAAPEDEFSDVERETPAGNVGGSHAAEPSE